MNQVTHSQDYSSKFNTLMSTVITSVIFLVAILGTVIYLTVSKKDAPKLEVKNS